MAQQAKELMYAVRFRVVFKYFGQLWYGGLGIIILSLAFVIQPARWQRDLPAWRLKATI